MKTNKKLRLKEIKWHQTRNFYKDNNLKIKII